MIKFYNTLRGKVEPFIPLVPGKVKLYTCGPTVYDFAHIGNFRAYVFEDLLKRFLQYMGLEVTHVMNITDVDDKTIKGAGSLGVTLGDFTRKYIDAFYEDIKTMNLVPADIYPRATEHIPEMVAMIKTLLKRGFAYEKEGSVYFIIAKFPDYGKLSKINIQDLKPGQRTEADEYEKESVHDFALWKSRKEAEPFWETELGPGRPGWHIECSAMSSRYLGETFDIHCGGVDNIFPHHENEIAQSEACSGKTFVHHWLHCHHLVVNGEKMSKSKGNFFTLRDLLDRKVDPPALRFLLLSTHYRKMLNFTFKALAQAQSSLQRMKDFLYELENRAYPEGESEEVSRLIQAAGRKFASGLSDDLNISMALTSVFKLIRKANILISREKLKSGDAENLIRFLRSTDRVLAVLPAPKESALPERLLNKIKERESARKERNYALADRIRRELLAEGILLEDTREGVRWKSVPRQKG